MLPDTTPHARLVVSRQLLLKSSEHFAHSGKHALYGNPPRWHLITPNKPAPKGAPVASHPHTAGAHGPAKHFTDEQWAALKLPEDNVNAGSHNKKIDHIKELSEGGHVTGLLGLGIGSNTYGKKQALVINHLLGLHGSAHKVTAGQKAGEHPAVQSAPAEPHPTGLPEHLAPKTTPDLQEPGPLAPLAQHVKDTLDEKAAEGNVDFLKMVAANNPEHPQIVAYAKEKLAELQAKAPALEATGNASAGTISAVDESKVPDLLTAATGPMSSKAYILAALQDKSKHKFVSMNGDAVVAAISFGVSSGTPDFPGKHVSVKNLGSSKPGEGSKLLNIAIEMAAKMGVPVALKAGSPGAAAFYKKHGFVDGANINMMVLPVANMKVSATTTETTPSPAPAASASPLTMPAFEEGKTTTGVKAYYEKVAQKVIDHGHAGNASVLDGMKEDGLKPNAKGKTTNTWLGKTANSKKLLALHAATLEHATGGAKPAGPKQTASEIVASGAGNAQLKEWLRDNPGKEGDLVAALQAAMKNHVVMQLGLDDVDPAASQPKEGDTKPAADGGTLVLKDGHWVKQGGDAPAAAPAIKLNPETGAPIKPDGQAFQSTLTDIEGWIADGNSGKLQDTLAALTGLNSAGAKSAAAYAKAGLRHLAAKPATPATPGTLSAQQLQNLQSIPWFKLKLPPENTNAKSHNAALAKIEAMAFAGDTAGLQAFIDAKAGAKQTYAKKQVLTAQTALAGLQQPGATAAVPVEPAPVAAAKPPHADIDPEQKQVLDELAAGEHWVDLEDLAEMHGPGTQVHAYAQKLLARKPTPEQMDAAAAPAAPAPQAPAKVKVAGKVYENTLNGHNKFWAVSTHGSVMKTTYGKIGTKGQETVKHFPSEAAAQAAAAKLTAEKKAKGYNMAGFVEHEHDAPGGPTPVAQPQGPKEGDTKQGADGMLVLKDGHWVKMDTGDDGPGDWAFSVNDPAFSGANTIGNHEVLMAFSPGDGAELHTSASMEAGYGEPELQAHTVHELVQKMAAAGHSVPPLSMLKKLDPGYEPPAAAAPPAIKKLDLLKVNHILQTLPPHMLPQAKFTSNAASKMALDAAKTGDAAGMAAAYSKAFDMGYKKTGGHIKAVAEAMGVDTSKWDSGSVATPAAAPAPAAKPAANNLPSMDSWIQTGPQGGSNPGGKFKDADGVEWYCKFPPDEGHARSEVLAAKLYEAAGLKSQDAKLVTKGGKVGIASRWVDVKKVGAEGLKDTPGALGGFVVDAWLANWDVVGMGYDNLQVGSDGRAVRIDAGGSLQYRAQGEAKPFGHKVEEIKTMRDPKKNPQAAAVFGALTAADMTASAKKVLSISDDQIHDLVMAHGPGDVAKKAELIDALIARKEDIAKQFPKAVPKEKVKPKPDPTKLKVSADQLPKPHDFKNWKGAGNGLSSKTHINEANQAAEQALLDTALKGNLIALKDYHFDALDKETGAVIGKKPIGEHPSNHVKTYWSDLVSTLSFIAYPPEALKKFKSVVTTSVAKVSDAFKAAKYGTTTKGVEANSRLAFWIALGHTKPAETLLPPGASLEFKSSPTGQPKVTPTMTEQAKAAYKALNSGRPVKRFINGIQSSGSYNDNFRDGRMVTTDGWDAAAMALDAYGYATEKPEGFELYKWISFPGDMGKQMLSAQPGTVFQNPGSMCCSTNATSTSGFGSDRVRIRYAKGAKGVDSFGSTAGQGAFKNEYEITTLPGQRFVILKCHKVMCPVKGKERIELDVLMLPPDPTYVAELEAMKGKHGGKS